MAAGEFLFQQSIDGRLGNCFVDLGSRAAGSDSADGPTVDLDRQTTLVGERVRKGEYAHVAVLEPVGGVLRWTAVERGVTGLPLRKLDGVETRGVAFLQK